MKHRKYTACEYDTGHNKKLDTDEVRMILHVLVLIPSLGSTICLLFTVLLKLCYDGGFLQPYFPNKDLFSLVPRGWG